MRILQLVTRRQYRGAEVFAATLSSELLKKGHEILFVGIYPSPSAPLTVEGAVNLDLNGNKKFLSFSLLKKVVQLVNEYQPDVVQANGSDTLKYAVFSGYLTKVKRPVIYRNISIVSSWVGSNPFKKQFYKFLFSRVDFVTSVGSESIADLINTFKFPPTKTQVIRRGIPLVAVDKKVSRQALIDRFNLKNSDRIVVHAGNYSAEKNHKFLIDVFSIVAERDPGIKLILVGDGDLFNEVSSVIRNKHLEHTVIQAGFRKDLYNFLAAADLFVLCSTIEGIPGVVLEAAAQSTPSLSVNVGGITEVIQNNETGVILEDYDINNYADTIIKLLKSSALLTKMGEKAYSTVISEFNPEKNADIFIKLYRSLLDKK